MGTSDPFELARFLVAQESVYPDALAEIRSGLKRTHWMWYVFPQLGGLGSSYNARCYSIRSLEEAKAYLDHPILGQRLIEITTALLGIEGKSAKQIFGFPDDLKLRSSATLFAVVSSPGSVFDRLLEKYYPEGRDDKTLQLLGIS